LGGRQIVLVSNREPYLPRQAGAGAVVERPPGGLVEALDPVMRAVGGVWIAWGSGGRDEGAGTPDRIGVPPEDPRYLLRRVWLPEQLVERYYDGYANQALWPLCHMAVDRARFLRRYWLGYQEANRRFAAAVVEEADPGALIWLQDYHLALAPRFIRAQRDDLFLAHFWHIPWPGWDILRVCPRDQRRALLDGLLGVDLLGFHLDRFRETFLECVQRDLEAAVDVDRGLVTYRGHQTAVRTFPISIDTAAMEALANSPAAVRWMRRWRERLGPDRALLLGVDRLDYTKGIPERLRAFDRLLSQRPALRERVVFVQKAAPSRTRIAAYRELGREVERLVAEINGRWGRGDWRPIVYIPETIPRAALAALYRLADVAVVSSLQDGMNLVAKEFIACQVDLRGVLLLSEFAGAAGEMAKALRINPYDEEGFADAMGRALAMPPAERRGRLAPMRAYLAQHDVYAWMEEVAAAVARLIGRSQETRPLSAVIEGRLLGDARRAPVLFLDYDGTLVPIAPTPQEAQPSAELRDLLRALARRVAVVIVSGRAAADLRRLLDVEGVAYMGNHGLEVIGGEQPPVYEAAVGFRHHLRQLAGEIRFRLSPVRGVLVEEKGFSVSVHYRLVDPSQHPRVAQVVRTVVDRARPWIALTKEKKVLELRPSLVWDKGRAVRWWLEEHYGAEWPAAVVPVYVGDDRTDEDAFAAIRGRGVTIAVAPEGPTAAAYAVESPAEVAAFLRRLADALAARDSQAGPQPPAARERLAAPGRDQAEPVEAMGPQREDVGRRADGGEGRLAEELDRHLAGEPAKVQLTGLDEA
jgi:trehalose 6-phosphate synthase